MKTNILKKGDFVKLIGIDNTYGWLKNMNDLIGKIGQITEIYNGQRYTVSFTKLSIYKPNNIKWYKGVYSEKTIESNEHAFSATLLKPIISYNRFIEKLDILDKYSLANHDFIYILHIRDIVNCKKLLDEPLIKVLKTLNCMYTKYKK